MSESKEEPKPEPKPADYEECGVCGFDHSYEHQEASDWHRYNNYWLCYPTIF